MNKPSIVVIAEDIKTQEEFKRILEHNNYDHVVARNGIDGIALSRMVIPSAIVVDKEIPQLQAIGVCKSLLADDRLRSIPVIVLAATASVDGELTTFSNFGGVLQRPIEESVVKSTLQTAFEAKRKAGGSGIQKPAKHREEPIKVLSVDDSSVVRKLVTMILTAEGFKVSTASDGLDGINKAKEIKPDIILLDFVMPKMNGFQVCRILQKDEKLRQIPVILVTSKGDKVGDKFVNQLGVTAYITKPFQPEELVTKIHQTLEAQEGTTPAPQIPQPPSPVAVPSVNPPEPVVVAPAATAVRTQAVPVAAETLKTMVQEEVSRIFAQGFEQKVEELVKNELEKLMKTLDKRIEKAVVEKMNEYIRRAKKK
ncbi:response regulator receiver protein [Candidatus Vecturithrix granuli]|uniref:Response regulator receiver protein n=1 Tax=Vecturithrix granuli TaxID=1499967 RepID=A0A0S6WAC4_VECG1|nr:response regulator receiver protein [Candidatus Vecturithrix granuli]